MSADITIRKAEADHAREVEACARAAYEKFVPLIGREPAPMVADFARQIARGIVEIAVDPAGRVAGFMVRYPRGAHLHIENLAIHPAFQGQGLGTRLLRRAEDTARELGLTTLELYTNAKMSEALAFYPARGFVEIDRRWEAGFDRVYFRKDLPDRTS
ncbi:GNAT family N-acetyltransferase [Dichotomicrobium thermohalophilum]|uniref:Acetyltransferase (GNAT) family protein n=1 Tax=Dichotomicrobium thermohalophilum TaxID=933063 RepID=A0A397QAX9_9HYPH|nr:GNAT family N-acetyltransferase [Dichotomicrobium thermohalophilum]RIA55274.1 acetyltransferase (GNAT) family protein [Dichotomicrobium thermohalophilum]